MPKPINTDLRTKRISLDIASGLPFLMGEVENDENDTVFLALPRILHNNCFILKKYFRVSIFFCLVWGDEYKE